MSLFDAAFEGPPSPTDMEYVVRDLLWNGKVDAAHSVVEAMLTYWQHSDASEATSRFYYWLGIRTATGTLAAVKRNRAHRRALGLARREPAAKRARTKPAALPVSNGGKS